MADPTLDNDPRARAYLEQMAQALLAQQGGGQPVNDHLFSLPHDSSRIGQDYVLPDVSATMANMARSIVESVPRAYRAMGDYWQHPYSINASDEDKQAAIRDATDMSVGAMTGSVPAGAAHHALALALTGSKPSVAPAVAQMAAKMAGRQAPTAEREMLYRTPVEKQATVGPETDAAIPGSRPAFGQAKEAYHAGGPIEHQVGFDKDYPGKAIDENTQQRYDYALREFQEMDRDPESPFYQRDSDASPPRALTREEQMARARTGMHELWPDPEGPEFVAGLGKPQSYSPRGQAYDRGMERFEALERDPENPFQLNSGASGIGKKIADMLLGRRGGGELNALKSQAAELEAKGASVTPLDPTDPVSWERAIERAQGTLERQARQNADALAAHRQSIEGAGQGPPALPAPPRGGSVPLNDRVGQAMSPSVGPGDYVTQTTKPGYGSGSVVAEADPRYAAQIARERAMQEGYQAEQARRQAYAADPLRKTEARVKQDEGLDTWAQGILRDHRAETSNAPIDVVSDSAPGFERKFIREGVNPLDAGSISDVAMPMDKIVAALMRRGYWFRDGDKHMNMSVLHERDARGRMKPLEDDMMKFRDEIARHPYLLELAKKLSQLR